MKKFSAQNFDGDQVVCRIRDACSGLVYVSEIDAEVVPFVGALNLKNEADAGPLFKRIKNGETPVIEVDFDEFFEKLGQIRDWQTVSQQEMARRYHNLYGVLKEYLRDQKVLKIGRTRIEIYAVGKDANDRLVGVRTEAVET